MGGLPPMVRHLMCRLPHAMSSTEPPKLRSDLLFSRQSREGQTIFVVKDPLNSQYFSLREEEHYLAAQLDGQTPFETVRLRVEERFNVTLSRESLANFVTSLRESELLESGPDGTGMRAKRGRWRGSLLYLRFKLFDPDELFNRLAGRVRFCFTPGFVASAAATIVWALLLAVANWDMLRADLSGLVRWEAVIWLLAAMFAVSTAHEFAHGLTCKHFGGEVREVGLLLMYFQPALYCNVSDTWLFPEKRKRLWVGFAGPYFELFLWACAVLVWRLTDPETSLNYGALAVLATSGFKTLLNFNPLLKLDGYYLLSDLLGVPNLRRRAYSYLGAGIKRLVGLGGSALTEIPRRERRICLAYGLVSGALSFSVLGFAVVKLGALLVDNRQPELLCLSIGLLGLKVRGRFRRLFGKSPNPSERDDLSIAEAATEPANLPSGEAPSDPNGAPRTSKPAGSEHKSRALFRRRVILALLPGIVLPLLFLGRMDLRIAGPFLILPIENADVRAEVGGTVEEVCVDEGNWVRAGAPMARLSDRDNRAALLKSEADIDQMRAQLRMLEAGPRPEEIELARIGVLRAEDRTKFAKNNFERDKQLLQEQLISQKDFEASKQAVVDGENEIAELKERLKLLLAGSRPEEIDATKAGLARLETQRRYLEEQLAHVKVTSPAAGIVTTPSRELKEMVGKVVKEGDLIATVHELKTVEVQTPVSEKDIADVKVGQKVALKARAYPEQTFVGVVSSVGTTVQGAAVGQSSAAAGTGGTSTSLTSGSGSASARTVLVTTRITNDALLLKPGMTGMVKIYCGDRRIFDLLTRRLARTIRVEFWSWW